MTKQLSNSNLFIHRLLLLPIIAIYLSKNTNTYKYTKQYLIINNLTLQKEQQNK